MRGESGINFTRLYICGAISFVMLVLNPSVIDNWSWWRVILPVSLFVGFHVINIAWSLSSIYRLPISRRDPMETKPKSFNHT